MPPELLENLRQRLQTSGLAAYSDAIIAAARPAIEICRAEGETQIGQSRFGGAPDLPASLSWPRNEQNEALAFLLQLNLAELPHFEGNPFPASGMFYVFLGLDEPATDVAHQLVLWTGDEPLQRASVPNQNEWVDETYFEILETALQFELIADVPHWASLEEEALVESMSETERTAFYDFSLLPSRCFGQILGNVHGIGHDPREDAVVVREHDPKWLYDYEKRAQLDLSSAKNWTNLLTLFSDYDLNFGVWDAGYLHFLISDSDLAKLDFSRVYAAVESS